MKLSFTKMHGAGNDFIVLDATAAPIELNSAAYRQLADRHFGIGADQILIVGPSPAPSIDFSYRIINADGSEVEQCGNGARCFMRFIHEKKLTTKNTVKVRTLAGDIVLQMDDAGHITVNMGAPVFELERIPFAPGNLQPVAHGAWQLWPLPLNAAALPASISCAVVSMGNPHVVQRVDNVDTAPVTETGPLLENHPCFPQRANVGFMQVVSRQHIKVRVYERGAGETLACGTGICAAVVCGIRLGWLDEQVDVDARGGRLQIRWAFSHGLQEPVWMSGPAQTVFEGVIEL
jgi:diaminopimelate epimerase